MSENAAETQSRSSEDEMAVVVSCRSVTKDFGSVRAIDDVNLDIHRGTIHALVGQNGAGKSTLLGVLAGRTAPTRGTVILFGHELPYGMPREIRDLGVAAIYQELMVVPSLSAKANVYLGQPISRKGILQEGAMREGFERLCRRFKESIPADVPAGALSTAQQQLLEIMRGLSASAKLMLFDEPTASLPPRDREALFTVMADLRSHGVTIIFVSHNLDEVLRIADVVTVFRDGRVVATAPKKEWTKARLVTTMLGRELTAIKGKDEQDVKNQDDLAFPSETVLRVQDLGVSPWIHDISFEIRRGEIVGLGGLVGSGRTRVLRALAGLEPKAKGRLWIDGVEASWPHTVRDARRLGIALVPEDRKTQGLVLGMSGADNIVMSDFRPVSRAGFISSGKTISVASAASARFGLPAERLSEASGNLSGGNQQKLLFARSQHDPPRILLADEPTRGVDVGAKAEILEVLKSLAAEGKGVLFASSELEEIAAICDRIVVLAEGTRVGEIEGGLGDATVEEILRVAFRVEAADG